MLTRAAFVVFGACAALVLSSSAAGHGQSAGRSCLPISLENTLGAFTYEVRIEAGSVECGLARSVLRDAADWPPGESAASSGWHCIVGPERQRSEAPLLIRPTPVSSKNASVADADFMALDD
jgi:hypothetical protein